MPNPTPGPAVGCASRNARGWRCATWCDWRPAPARRTWRCGCGASGHEMEVATGPGPSL